MQISQSSLRNIKNLSPTCSGSVPHTQMTSNTIVTMTMASHSSHATAVTTSAIPVGKFFILCFWLERCCVLPLAGCGCGSLFWVNPSLNFFDLLLFTAKVVPQPIAHSSSRVQPDYPGERTNLIPIPGHRSSPNPVTMEARSDNRWAQDCKLSLSHWHCYTRTKHLWNGWLLGHKKTVVDVQPNQFLFEELSVKSLTSQNYLRQKPTVASLPVASVQTKSCTWTHWEDYSWPPKHLYVLHLHGRNQPSADIQTCYN